MYTCCPHAPFLRGCTKYHCNKWKSWHHGRALNIHRIVMSWHKSPTWKNANFWHTNRETGGNNRRCGKGGGKVDVAGEKVKSREAGCSGQFLIPSWINGSTIAARDAGCRCPDTEWPSRCQSSEGIGLKSLGESERASEGRRSDGGAHTCDTVTGWRATE